MRPILALMLTFGLSSPVWAQGSLMDLGKGVLKQQLENQIPGTQSSGGSDRGAGLPVADIAKGLKEALRVGSQTVTQNLGRTDGFNKDPLIHIPLPDSLKTVQSGLKMVGQSGLADDLEVKLNRAAESATPEAKRIFLGALDKMSLDDARAILNGPQDAATQYFKRTMSPDLKTAMRPVVDRTVGEAGAVKSMESLTAATPALGLAGNPKNMLTDHVLDYALAGIFTYLAKEEAAIRQNPAKRTSDILKTVFGK